MKQEMSGHTTHRYNPLEDRRREAWSRRALRVVLDPGMKVG